jgi:drug/metabolite transporter (DMT)-like permease
MLGGGAFFFSKVALAELCPFTVVLGRVGIAALILNLIVWASGQRMPAGRKTWGAFLVMGALNNLIPFSLIFWGQTQIASGLASILNASAPLWTLLLAHLSGDERLTAHRLGGAALGLLGVTVMIGPDVLGGLGLKMLAQLAVLGAAFSYALAGIYGRRFKAIPSYVTAAG